MKNNKSIIKKIRDLLETANRSNSVSEAQSAMVLAQKLMLKYKISVLEIKQKKSFNDLVIDENGISEFKQLAWWEKELANTIACNFRVKIYLTAIEEDGVEKRKLNYYGEKSDVELASEMYQLGYATLIHYTKKAIDNYYQNNFFQTRTPHNNNKLSNSYIRGFLIGLKNKFYEQAQELERNNPKHALVLLVPIEVEKAYHERFNDLAKDNPVKRPNVFADTEDLFKLGFKEGHGIDFNKRTISTTA
ncbi:DUF2786 domain-containing protein [Lysinibacillus sp. 1P01SD]|uniref:DUF2786 domain-containing protein n=1 Tax=Lysinibacillus sp. 1P01SD TaxID=3132285 RepID=UPI0039A0C50D